MLKLFSKINVPVTSLDNFFCLLYSFRDTELPDSLVAPYHVKQVMITIEEQLIVSNKGHVLDLFTFSNAVTHRESLCMNTNHFRVEARVNLLK